MFDPKDGKFLAKYGAYGEKDGQFSYPSSIAYDPQRDWFAVADSSNSRVQIVRIPDSGADPLGAVRRQLAGPIRACLVPLALLLLSPSSSTSSSARGEDEGREGTISLQLRRGCGTHRLMKPNQPIGERQPVFAAELLSFLRTVYIVQLVLVQLKRFAQEIHLGKEVLQ